MNLNQVTLPSTDVARSVAFYRALGFNEIVSDLPYYARFECPAGGSTFSLHLVDSVVSDSGVVVYFECDDLDAEFRNLTARGFEFESPPTDQPWLWREAYLRDPDRNVICLYRAGENRRNPPWRIPSPAGPGAT
jgi:catechol 2,3-dioxygenase-like lactoylglutathione lyase family enzyme